MAADTKQPAVSPGSELAKRIYVELVARNVEIVESAVKMKASAANLASLSIKLAEAYMVAEQQAIDAKAPVTTYKLEGSDIAEWSK